MRVQFSARALRCQLSFRECHRSLFKSPAPSAPQGTVNEAKFNAVRAYPKATHSQQTKDGFRQQCGGACTIVASGNAKLRSPPSPCAHFAQSIVLATQTHTVITKSVNAGPQSKPGIGLAFLSPWHRDMGVGTRNH
jgi:hypothetical protein